MDFCHNFISRFWEQAREDGTILGERSQTSSVFLPNFLVNASPRFSVIILWYSTSVRRRYTRILCLFLTFIVYKIWKNTSRDNVENRYPSINLINHSRHTLISCCHGINSTNTNWTVLWQLKELTLNRTIFSYQKFYCWFSKKIIPVIFDIFMQIIMKLSQCLSDNLFSWLQRTEKETKLLYNDHPTFLNVGCKETCWVADSKVCHFIPLCLTHCRAYWKRETSWLTFLFHSSRESPLSS